MSWTMKNTKKTIIAILLCICFTFWVVYLIARIDIYNYRFLTVSRRGLFLIFAIIVPCIPLAIWISTIVALKKSKKHLTIILLILYFLSLLLAFFLAPIELLAFPTTCSYTSDIDNFGIFDTSLALDLDLNPVTAFPKEIPKAAKNLQYCYFYQSSSSDIVYIAITWKLEDNTTYEKIIEQYVPELYDSSSYNSGCLQENSYFCNAVLTDNKTNTIGFVITSQEALLPKEINGMIKSPSFILN